MLCHAGQFRQPYRCAKFMGDEFGHSRPADKHHSYESLRFSALRLAGSGVANEHRRMMKTATPQSTLASSPQCASRTLAALFCFLIVSAGSVRAQAPSEPAKATIESVRLEVSPLVPKTAEGERNLLVASIDSAGLSNVTVRLTSPAWPAKRQPVDWSSLPCEARFWDWKLGPARPHYL